MGINSVRFLIIATGYNCEKYVADCVKSVEAQTYKNFDVIYIDDASTDNTFRGLLGSVKMGYYSKTETNLGTVKCREIAIRDYKYDYDVIVWLDLDDKLKPNALEVLATVYKDKDVWMTYGNYVTDKGEQPFKDVTIPDDIHNRNAYREYPFMFMHLRSYRKELYFNLTPLDLYPNTGWIYQDANLLFSMMEMSGKEHMKSINEPLYIYTVTNSLSLLNRYTSKERKEEYKKICSIKPRERLTEL